MTNVTIKRDTSIFGSIDGNLVLSPNDTVFVKNYNSTVNIIGEVNEPGRKVLNSNTSLIHAILQAGGPINWRSNKGNVRLLRVNNDGSAGSANTGGGGGSHGNQNPGFHGGSGIVLIAYPT